MVLIFKNYKIPHGLKKKVGLFVGLFVKKNQQDITFLPKKIKRCFHKTQFQALQNSPTFLHDAFF